MEDILFGYSSNIYSSDGRMPTGRDDRDMFGEEGLKLMQPIARLVNVVRGGVVNEKALVKVLKEGNIENAATDVFGEEPAMAKIFWSCSHH
jgi:phosphoglycerate dehydrogenase-like enzyme